MTVPFVCVAIAFFLIYLPKIFSSVAMAKQPGGFDNRHPRDQQAKLGGWGRRAQAAHLNSVEAFAPFAAAVIVAHLAHANAQYSAVLAITFIVARTIYPFLYMANLDRLRSTAWAIGIGCVGGLFLLGFAS